jgi:hypothetical protein
MIDKKMRVWLAASAGVVLVMAGAVAVAATDWGAGRPQAQSGEAQTASAGDTSGGGGGGGGTGRRSYRGSSNLFLLRYDADHDGRITRAEVDAGIVAEFQTIDSNHDGRLDAAEYQRYEEARRAARASYRAQHPDGGEAQDPERPSTWDPMKRLDWNRDGFISLEEFGGRTRGAAMRADRDGDGVVLADDLLHPQTTRRTASAQ